MPTKIEPQENSANVVTRAEFIGFFKAARPTANAAIQLKRYVSLSDVSVRIEEPVVIQIKMAAKLIEPIARSAKSNGLDLTVLSKLFCDLDTRCSFIYFSFSAKQIILPNLKGI